MRKIIIEVEIENNREKSINPTVGYLKRLIE